MKAAGSILYMMASARVAFGAAIAAQNGASVTPIQKVLTLLGDMLAKGKQEKEDEATKFASFEQWCSDIKRTKT